MNPDMNRNGNFALVLGWRGNTTHIHDFCTPLDFLGIKDLKKNKKRTKIFSKAIAKASATYLLTFYVSFALLMWFVLTQEFGGLKEFDPQGHKGQKG